jgi:hypothetical protein
MSASNGIYDCTPGPDCQCRRAAGSNDPFRSIIIKSDGAVLLDGMPVETWPNEAKLIVHGGNQCVHVTISSHVSRPLKDDDR